MTWQCSVALQRGEYWPIRGQCWGHVISMGQSEASVGSSHTFIVFIDNSDIDIQARPGRHIGSKLLWTFCTDCTEYAWGKPGLRCALWWISELKHGHMTLLIKCIVKWNCNGQWSVCLSVLTNTCPLLDSWAMMMLNDKSHQSSKLQRWLNEDSDRFKYIVGSASQGHQP